MGVSVALMYGVVAMMGFGLSNAIYQVPARRIGPAMTIFYRNAWLTVFLFLLSVAMKQPIGSVPAIYMAISLGIAIVGFIPLISFLQAVKAGTVGVVAPVASTSLIFTVLFSVLFYHEALSSNQWVAIAMICMGIILISINFSDVRRSQLFSLASGIPFALVSAVGWGLVFALYKIPVDAIGPVLTALITEFGIFLCSFAFVIVSKQRMQLTDAKSFWSCLVVALFGAVAIVSYMKGISLAGVSVVASVGKSGPIVSTIYGALVYRERLRMQQYGGITLAILGVIALSFYST